jgi:hypothetical protein
MQSTPGNKLDQDTRSASGRWRIANPRKRKKGRSRGPDQIRLERETGFEPATSTLARLHSTTELFPQMPA